MQYPSTAFMTSPKRDRCHHLVRFQVLVHRLPCHLVVHETLRSWRKPSFRRTADAGRDKGITKTAERLVLELKDKLVKYNAEGKYFPMKTITLQQDAQNA